MNENVKEDIPRKFHFILVYTVYIYIFSFQSFYLSFSCIAVLVP